MALNTSNDLWRSEVMSLRLQFAGRLLRTELHRFGKNHSPRG